MCGIIPWQAIEGLAHGIEAYYRVHVPSTRVIVVPAYKPRDFRGMDDDVAWASDLLKKLAETDGKTLLFANRLKKSRGGRAILAKMA